MFYGIIQTSNIPTSDKHNEQSRRMSKPTTYTNYYLEFSPHKEPEFFFLLEPPDPCFFLFSIESLALLTSWLFENKGNCIEELVALKQSSSETSSTVVFSISVAIQSSYGKTLVFTKISIAILSCGMD